MLLPFPSAWLRSMGKKGRTVERVSLILYISTETQRIASWPLAAASVRPNGRYALWQHPSTERCRKDRMSISLSLSLPILVPGSWNSERQIRDLFLLVELLYKATCIDDGVRELLVVVLQHPKQPLGG